MTFRHDLVRSIVEDDIPAPIRAALHREAAGIARVAGAPATTVASHLLRSLTGPDATAVEWLLDAASAVFAASPSTAAELLERAEAACPGGALMVRLLARRAEALLWSGRPADALAIAERARSLPDAHGDTATEDARRLDDVVSQALFFVGRPVDAVAVSTQDQLSAGRLAQRALARVLAADPHGAQDDARAALAAATDAERSTRSLALSVQAWAALLGPDFAAALELAGQAVAVADADPTAWRTASTRCCSRR